MNKSVARDIRTIKFLAFGLFLLVLGDVTNFALLIPFGVLAGVFGVAGQYADGLIE